MKAQMASPNFTHVYAALIAGYQHYTPCWEDEVDLLDSLWFLVD